jgi:adenine-specific DNA glycosylase
MADEEQRDNDIDSKKYMKKSLSARAARALINKNRIATFRRLMDMSPEEIKSLHGIGKKTAEEIMAEVARLKANIVSVEVKEDIIKKFLGTHYTPEKAEKLVAEALEAYIDGDAR